MNFLDRMEKEFEELETRLLAGESFITNDNFARLDIVDQRLLFAQLSAMEAYSEILYSRIIRFKEYADTDED